VRSFFGPYLLLRESRLENRKTLWELEVIDAAGTDLYYTLTNGDIAVNNLESSRQQSWSRFWRDALRVSQSKS
jgi:hypothetical protein